MGAATVLHATISKLDDVVGGAARRRVIVALAAVLALNSADTATIGTSAVQLQAGLDINKAQIGLLLTVSGLVGALAAIPFGALVDRTVRTRLLRIAVLAWGVATALSGAATSYLFLMFTRIGLGIVTAVAGPAIAALLGDYFPQRERGRIYGYVLSGELIGVGFGFVVSGQFALLSWRAPFFVLVAPSVLVWWLLTRISEPERGGQKLEPENGSDAADAADADDTTLVREAVRNDDVEPRKEAVLKEDPAQFSMWRTVRYVLAVRTNVVLIVASTLSYFFFSGVRAFAVEFAAKHYGLGHSAATTLTLALGIGAFFGVLMGGRLADRLLRGGRIPARVEIAGVAVLFAGLLFVPAIMTTSALVALPLLVLAALCLGASNPPLDAARLDIIHPATWGRAEAVRTFLRSCGDAAAPLLFGGLATYAFGRRGGLEYTFLVMLTPLLAAAIIMWFVGRRTYPNDVAAVTASETASSRDAAS